MREAEALARGSDFPAVIVRFGGIYGPGRTRFMKRALRAEAAGNTTSEQALGGEGHLGEISEDAAKAHENLGGVSKGAVKVGENQRNVGEGAAKGSEGAAHERWGNRIHRDDCAGVLHHLMDITQVKSIYCAVDEAPAPQSEVARWLYERHVALKAPGRPAPGRPEPGRPEPARAAAIDRLEGVSGIARQEGDTGDDRDIPPTGSAPAGSARSRGLASSGIRGKRCSNEQIKASGYKFRYPTYQEGYEALLLGEEI
ncbi:MAG: hypothetical protein HOE85_17270 [Nitrospinaceae bacterium]|nr:hypothetical protein [Nitrospinaceae bacterium]